MTFSLYQELMGVILNEGIRSKKGFAYMLDFASRLREWHQGHEQFKSWVDNSYYSICQTIQAGSSHNLLTGSRYMVGLLKEMRDNLALPRENRAFAAWTLSIRNRPQKNSGYMKTSMILANWLKELEVNKRDPGNVISLCLSSITTIPEQHYNNYVVAPLLQGIALMLVNPIVYYAKLVANGDILATQRLLTYSVGIAQNPNAAAALDAVRFLTEPVKQGSLKECSIASLIAKHHSSDMNLQLQRIFYDLQRPGFTIHTIIPYLLGQAHESQHYGFHLVVREHLDHSIHLLSWLQQNFSDPISHDLPITLPSNYLMQLIAAKDGVINKKLLALLMRLLMDPHLPNAEFLRLNKVFAHLCHKSLHDMTEEFVFQQSLQHQQDRLTVIAMFHQLEGRRSEFDASFADSLRRFCHTLLTVHSQTVDSFKEYVEARVKNIFMDNTAKTLCHIYLQCFAYKALHEREALTKRIQQMHQSAERAEKIENELLPGLVQLLPSECRDLVSMQLLNNEKQLIAYSQLFTGIIEVEEADETLQAMHGVLEPVFEQELQPGKTLRHFVGIIVSCALKMYEDKALVQSSRQKKDVHQTVEFIEQETAKLKHQCSVYEEMLRQFFMAIQNNYSKFPDFLLTLLNLNEYKMIWYPAFVALASVDKRQFHVLFYRAFENEGLFETKSSMLMAVEELHKNNLLEKQFYMHLFMDKACKPHAFAFKIAKERDEDVSDRLVECIAAIQLPYNQSAFLGASGFLDVSLLEMLFHSCSITGCGKLIEILSACLFNGNLSAHNALSIYQLCEQIKGNLRANLAPLEIRSALKKFLHCYALIRLHYYMEMRAEESLDQNFEKRLQFMMTFLETRKAGDLSVFQSCFRSQRFSEYLQSIYNLQRPILENALQKYTLFLSHRLFNPDGKLSMPARIIDARLLLALIKPQPSQQELVKKTETFLSLQCEQFANQLQERLLYDYNRSLLSLTWLSEFSPYARQLIAKHVASNQVYAVPCGRFFDNNYLTALQQQQLTTESLWCEYLAAKQSRSAATALCDWLNQHCIEIRQRSSPAVCDTIYPALYQLIDVDWCHSQPAALHPLLLQYPDLTVALIQMITRLLPKSHKTYAMMLSDLADTPPQIKGRDAEEESHRVTAGLPY